jgi:hypothetical protein
MVHDRFKPPSMTEGMIRKHGLVCGYISSPWIGAQQVMEHRSPASPIADDENRGIFYFPAGYPSSPDQFFIPSERLQDEGHNNSQNYPESIPEVEAVPQKGVYQMTGRATSQRCDQKGEFATFPLGSHF